MQFLSDEWADAYSSLLNENKKVQKKLKRFSTLFKYEVTDKDEIQTLVMEVVKGQCISYGPESAFNADILSLECHPMHKLGKKYLTMK